MRREDLYRAIGELPEKTLHSAEQGWSHSGIFRQALTAAACLILAVGIGSLFFLNRGTGSADPAEPSVLSEETDLHANCRETHQPYSDSILIGDVYYESDYAHCPVYPEEFYTDGTLWCYDPSVGETQVLADMAVRFSETQTGNYCTDVTTGDIYRIEGTALTQVAALPDYNSWFQEGGDGSEKLFVDLVGDDLYYRESPNEGVAYCVMDVHSGTVRRLSEPDNAIGQDVFRMWDGRIYYLKHGEENLTTGRAPIHLWALDVFTGENQEVTPQGWPEDMYYMYQNAGWGNFWLFAVSHGVDGDSVYQLDLSDRSFAELGRIDEFASQASIRQEGETVYWSSYFAAATGFCLTVTEYDMETKTAVEREDVIPIGFDDSVLCSFPCGVGCYYDETWESHTDTYYYDYATGTAVCISPAQTETNPATAERVTHDGGEICWDECAALQEGDNLYYSTWQYYPERGDVVSPGLWYYDVENGTSELLGSFAAAFTQTLNGNFCTDRDGTVYRLENGTMERIGTVPQNEYGGNCTLLDVVGDTAYYTSASEMGGSVDIWEKALSDGGSGRQIYVGEPGYTLEKAACRNGTIYYETLYHTADPSFWALDVETGENTQLEFDFPYDEHGGLYLTHICEFYEDCILLLGQFYDNTEGLFRLDYETLAAEETWRLESGMYAPIYREGDLIYFSSVGWVNDETGAQTRMVSAVSLDVNRGDVELKGVPDEAGDMWAASRGCYYQKRPDSPADTAESMEIYYYNYETRESVCINYECLKTYQNNTPGS